MNERMKEHSVGMGGAQEMIPHKSISYDVRRYVKVPLKGHISCSATLETTKIDPKAYLAYGL